MGHRFFAADAFFSNGDSENKTFYFRLLVLTRKGSPLGILTTREYSEDSYPLLPRIPICSLPEGAKQVSRRSRPSVPAAFVLTLAFTRGAAYLAAARRVAQLPRHNLSSFIIREASSCPDVCDADMCYALVGGTDLHRIGY